MTELEDIVDHNKNLDAKDLLGAFVKKSYEKYLQTKGINEILLEIEEIKRKRWNRRTCDYCHYIICYLRLCS